MSAASRAVGSTVAGLLLVVTAPGGAAAQTDSCASCHFSRTSTADLVEQVHLDDWATSPHASAQVGCEACHLGDPAAPTRIDAHRGVLSADDPSSPVFPRNLPETCGACHLGQLDAFVTSRHDALLAGGDLRAPTCATCHGAVAARLPSTRGISSRCATCHGPAGSAPLTDHHELVRRMRDEIQDHRYSLALVRTVIEYTADPARRADLIRRLADAEAPLDDAVAAWHAFAFDEASAPLERAGARIRALVDLLTPN